MQEFVYRLNVEDDFNKLRYVKGFTFRHDINIEKSLLNNIHRPKRADALSVKIRQVYSPNGNNWNYPLCCLLSLLYGEMALIILEK